MRVRTGYSFRNSVGMIETVMDRLIACGYEAAPISDRASTFGWVRWKKLAAKKDMRPIFGVELAVTDRPSAKRPIFDHWTFFAIDDIAAVNKLIELATSQFRYEPLLTYDQAIAAKGLLKIAGHRSDFSAMYPAENVFVGLSPSSQAGYIRRAVAEGYPLLATSDNRYTLPEDRALYEVICGRNASSQSYDQFIQTPDEWAASVEFVATEAQRAEAWSNRQEAMKLCTAQLVKGELFKPPHPKTLRKMCEEGAKKLGVNLKDKVYKERLKKELDLIKLKNFEDYFYIIADVVGWARERMIVGPARGSSCGSLVCYLLQITTIDPIPHQLIFERFIDVNRDDLPDVDIDFSDSKRKLVFDYVMEKYGTEHVARLGTVAVYQPRSAISEAGAALNVPRWLCDKVIDSLIERSSGDSRALQTLEDTFYQTEAGKTLLERHPEILVSAKMEGHPRHSSQHAAGIILTDRPVDHFVAIDQRSGATMCDKKDAEELGLLKIDALGLTQLSIFEDALEMAGLPINHLDTLPLDDEKAFDVLNRHQYSGIFQFNGQALQSIVEQVKITEFEDIVAITALARPGPMVSGGTNEWIKRKTGQSAITYPHDSFEPYLSTTMGIVAYQEQVMEIGRQIGGLSWGDVTELRKAMSKSLGKEYFDKFGERWKPGAIKKGLTQEAADKIWDELCAYGSWAFNRSHSVAYGLISYWCCWLKAHHPLEFAAATLTHTDDPKRQLQILREMRDEGIDYIPIDEERSTDRWQVGTASGKGKVLIGPVQNVRGIGPKLVQQIVSARHRNEPLPDRAKKLLASPKTPLDSLWPVRDAIERVMPDPAARNIHSSPTPIGDIQPDGTKQTVMVFAVAETIRPRDENELQNIAKRNGLEVKGPTAYLNLTMTDDTGSIFAKVNRYKYAALGQPIVDRGRPDRSIYAIKGSVPKDFRMISVEQVRYIGDMVEGYQDDEEGETPLAYSHGDVAQEEAVEEEAEKEDEDGND